MRPSPTRGLRFLEAEGMGYAIRLPANSILQSKIGYLLKRPVGRTAHDLRRYFASFSYQAESWRKPRRVVAKVEWHSRASALSSSTWFVRPSALSPSTIGAAQRSRRARVQSSGRGCRAGPFAATRCASSSTYWPTIWDNFMRTLAMPKAAEPWSLTSLREKLIKLGAKVVSHGGTSRSRWPRSRCRVRCSTKSCR